MSTLAVAKRDFLDVRRAKLVWAPVALYTLFMLVFFWGQTNTENPDFYNVLWGLLGIGGALVVPLIALVAAYLSIAGERESGTIKFTLGAPVDRSAVVLGKLVARSGVVLVGLLVSFVIGTVVAQLLVPDMAFEYGDYAAFVGVTLLYALAYVSVAVGISAAAATRSRAMAGGIGFFFLFNIVWNFLPVSPTQMLEFVLRELGRDPDNYRNLLELVFSLSPTGAYLNSMELYMPARVVERATQVSATGDPFYAQSWFMLVILGAWAVVPIALGLWRFERAQLG
ncbi:MAG: ABC transporter permease [Haloarculaceae archaeon]